MGNSANAMEEVGEVQQIPLDRCAKVTKVIGRGESNGTLAKISQARRALEAAKTLDDVLRIRDQAAAVAQYLKASRESLEVANQAAEIKIRAERKAGEITAAMEHGKDGRKPKETCNSVLQVSKSEQLAEVGLDRMAASRLEDLARIPEDRFEDLVRADTATAEGRELTTADLKRRAKDVHVSHNSGEMEWYTPSLYVDAARKVMGGIDLDPASSDVAQDTVGAGEYFTAEEDGLEYEWHGRVFLNPPYGKDAIGWFVDKLLSEISERRVEQAILLTNNATDTAWWQTAADMASAVCFTRGRIAFNDATGKPVNKPLQGQSFLYFGGRTKSFVRVFREFGECWSGTSKGHGR